MGSVKVPESLQNCRRDSGMCPAFGVAEAVDVVGGPVRVADHAREALVAIEAKVLAGDEAREAEEALQVGENCGRVGDEALAADEVQLRGAELRQPAAHVDRVQTDLDRAPPCVHRRRRAGVVADERQLLERRDGATPPPLGARLCVVGEGAGDRVAKDHDEPDVPRHASNSPWNAARDEVARRLLDRQLATTCHRHLTPSTHAVTHTCAVL